MTQPFVIGGARTVIPGVYDKFRVDDSLLTPAVAGRSVLIAGEAIEGVPGNLLDLSLNFFSSYQDVQDFYKSGPIVDAARQLFTRQPGDAFNGQVDRLYIYKTNASERASKALANSYGSIVAARFGEAGNFIKSQISAAQSETLPSLSFHYLPSSGAATIKFGINGNTPDSIALAPLAISGDQGTPTEFVTDANGVSGLTAIGGVKKTSFATGTSLSFSLASPSAGVLSLTVSGGTFSVASLAVDDLAVIPLGEALSGAADANAGCYLVQSVTASTFVLKRLAGLGVAVAAFDLTAIAATPIADINDSLGVFSKITLTQTDAPVAGSAATLELQVGSASNSAAAKFFQSEALSNIISQASATVGSLSATASGSVLTLNLAQTSWTTNPKAGDVIWISQDSPIAGAGLANVGAWIVTASSFKSATMISAYGLSGISVALAPLEGNISPIQLQKAVATTSVAAKRLDSAAEAKVSVLASRTSDGAAFPTTAVGGTTALELSFDSASATDCTVSIDQTRKMTFTFVGGPTSFSVNLKKYASLGEVVDYLNTVTGMSAKASDLRMKSDSPAVLDMVSGLHIISGSSLPAYNGKIKRDYADFKRLLDDNFSLIAFLEGSASLKVGLPAVEASMAFLTGGVVGASSNSSFQAALDAGLKIEVRNVIPLVSRDANKDIDDALTDENSAYTIDSIHSMTQAHVATASSTLFKRERFGGVSFLGSFADSKDKASAIAFERLQLGFQLVRATGSDGTLKYFLPWMGMCALAAGRSQAEAGTPMLRKSFNFTAVKHIGDKSIFDDALVLDFDPEDQGLLTQAIEAGLLVWQAARGAGVQLKSPDLTTRSRDGDPQGWVYERASVLFACDEARQSLRTTLENLIGLNTFQVSEQDVRRTADSVLRSFVSRGVLIRFAINSVTSIGSGYNLQVDLFPPEAIEFIGIDVLAKRNV